MKYLFFLCGLISIRCYDAKPADPECVGVKYKDKMYERELLKDGLKSPAQMTVDHETNTLFYSVSTDVKDEYQEKYLDLNTNKGGDVDGIVNGYASAVDNGLNVVYLGGKDGLYKYDYESKKAVKFPVSDDNIKQMFFKDYLYYITRDDKAYFIDNGVKKVVPQLKDIEVSALALDNDADLIYSNETGLFKYNREKDTTKMMGQYDVVAFAADIHDIHVFFTTEDNLYFINFLEKTIERTVHFGEHVTGIAVDAEDNLLYALGDSIYRFKKTKKACSTPFNP